MSNTSKMHAERLEFIKLEPVRETYRYLIDYASRLQRFYCFPYQNGVIKSFRYADSETQPKEHCKYSFITNKTSLLFYFRRPSEVAEPDQLLANLGTMFSEVNRNTKDQITVRIKNIGDARRLMEFIFEQRFQISTKGASRKAQQTNDSPVAIALAEKRSVILSDDVALENEPGQLAEFAPQDGDERALIERQIRERRGQQSFRNDLRKRYGDRCLVTGCKVLAVLEAAHIKPYQGEKDNHPENGLLLRADIHTLFDLDLLGIEPRSLRIELHPDLAESAAYKHLASKTLRCPDKQRPSTDALKLRYKRFQERFDS